MEATIERKQGGANQLRTQRRIWHIHLHVMRVGIGIIGAGNVGGALAARLVEDADVIAAKSGIQLELVRLAVRDVEKVRPFDLPSHLITTNAMEVVHDDRVQLVVELIGGTSLAYDVVAAALSAGKPVVTANKALVAAHGFELIQLAESAGVSIFFEAAVGGGIPIIRPLSQSLAGETITRVMGIVNGTTNFILTKMDEDGASYADVLAEAQALGYAEADPTADVSGGDAAAKAAILASLAFGTWIDLDMVYHEGIDQLQSVDLARAKDLGYTVKLLAIAEADDRGIAVRVHPTLVPLDHPLAAIRGATNAIFLEGPSTGELLFSGPGAGGTPTATAVLGDVISASRSLLAGVHTSAHVKFQPGQVLDFLENHTSRYYRFVVDDEPGVLAAISGAFAAVGVSIASVWQEGSGDEATLLITTHSAAEGMHQQAAAALDELSSVREVAATLRVLRD